MGNDEIGVAQLPIQWRHAQHDPSQPGNQELKQKRHTEEHGSLEVKLASPHGGQPVKNLDASGDGDGHGGKHKKCIGIGAHAHGKHVVGPNAHADESDTNGRGDHHGIAKNGFAGKHRNNFGGNGEGGKHQDVNFRMAKNPEEMHPDHG